MSEVVQTVGRQIWQKKIEISFGKNPVVGQAQEQVGVLNQQETLLITTKKQRSALIGKNPVVGQEQVGQSMRIIFDQK